MIKGIVMIKAIEWQVEINIKDCDQETIDKMEDVIRPYCKSAIFSEITEELYIVYGLNFFVLATDIEKSLLDILDKDNG